MRTILLGEAPKHPGGYAFDWTSWTTEQIARVVGVPPYHLNKVFWVMNIFEQRQASVGGGYDQFSVRDAVDEIGSKWFESQRIICVGVRVARAMEIALDLAAGSIPENRFERWNGTARGNGWELARIPHPSGLRANEDRDGLVLPVTTRRFLVRAAA